MVDLTMQIRPARPDDTEKIDGLIAQSIRMWKPHYSTAQISSSLDHLFSMDPALVTEETYYVAATDEQIVGCCGWSQGTDLAGAATRELTHSFKLAEIRSLFVHPQWLHRGIGGRLLRTCEALAEGAGFLHVTAMATLSGARFYRHHGFTELEQRALRLPDGALFPIVRMKKRLSVPMNSEPMFCI